MALYTHLAAALAAAALAGAAGWKVRDWQADATIAGMRERAVQDVRAIERAWERRVTDADKALAEANQRNARRAAGDRSELERLRDAIAARDAQPEAAACRGVEESFRECRAALAEGAGLVAEGADLGRKLDAANEALRAITNPEGVTE